MRIALDATPLTVSTGGIARYTAELAGALAAEFPADEFWLLSDQAWQAPLHAPNLRAGSPPRSWLARRWWLAGLPLAMRKLGIQVFHGTDFAVPYLPLLPSILTLHDLSPWAAGLRRAFAAERIRRRTPLLLRLATMIVTPTEAMRREAIERFNLPPSRVVAVPLAAGPQFRPRSEPEITATLARLGVSPPYILFVGTHEPRKNLARLIAAWREARPQLPDVNLVLAGRPGESSAPGPGSNRGVLHPLLNLEGESGLTMTGPLADADLAALLAGAAIFVYPSLYEGFGLPVLEAMQSGVPVVISRDPALLEVSGGAAVAVDADSTSELARAIVELMKDPARKQQYRQHGLRRASEFSWRRTAIATREVYVEALRRF